MQLRRTLQPPRTTVATQPTWSAVKILGVGMPRKPTTCPRGDMDRARKGGGARPRPPIQKSTGRPGVISRAVRLTAALHDDNRYDEVPMPNPGWLAHRPCSRTAPVSRPLRPSWSRRMGTLAFLLLTIRPLPPVAAEETCRLIFDTDITGDCDDVLALAMCHALADRNACTLLAVTISKDNPLTAAFVDAVDTFYGRPSLPIGVTRDPQAQRRASKYLSVVRRDHYPHDLRSNDDAEDAVQLLRSSLAGQPDGGVTIVSVGTATNLAGLLRSAGDTICPLNGRDLVRRKVALLGIMAGSFAEPTDGTPHREANVINHLAAMRSVADEWPEEVPVHWSGWEIGMALRYPRSSIADDYRYVPRHIVREAYLVHSGPDHDRPCWDQSSVLDAVWPDRGYFTLSPAGRVSVDADGRTRFTVAADGHGRDRHLMLVGPQETRALEAIVQLSSQPPARVFSGVPSPREP